MKNKINIFVLLLLTCALVSCSKAFILEVFNNTGAKLELVGTDMANNETRYTIEPDKSERIKTPFLLTVKKGSAVWTYAFRTLPPKQAQDYGLITAERHGPLIEKFQIEPDGSIYILPGGTKVTVKTFPPQPSGFPVKPRP